MSDAPVTIAVIAGAPSGPQVVLLALSGAGVGADGERLLIGLSSPAVVDDLIERLLTARVITFGLKASLALTQGFPPGGERP